MHTLESSKTRYFSPLVTRPGAEAIHSSTPRLIETSEPTAPLVLVVDDHDDSRAIERLVLESAGFRVVEARNGFEGLRVAAETRPLVVLLDMVLPGIDGWEIARLLRLDENTRHAVVIAVTALAGSEDQDRALLAGCDEVLTKPVPPTAMLDTVRRYVGLPVSAGARMRKSVNS